MDLTTRLLTMGAAGGAGAEKIYVEDVFSTWLYTGNGSTQTITNGIDLSGKGGLVWCKRRDSSAYNHLLYDTARGVRNYISSDTTTQAQTQPSGYGLTSFNSSGFTVGDYSSTGYGINESGALQASWTFRKAAKFFDVVTYTGTGSARTVAHNLGSVPGCIIIKRTDANGDWPVYHVSLGNTDFLELNQTQAKLTNSAYWNNTTPTSTVFSLGDHPDLNSNGATYVAYLFAHDAGGFGDSGNDSVVKCGSFSGSSVTVDLGWEPQWLLVKRVSTTSNWFIVDNMRGIAYRTNTPLLFPNLSSAESATSEFYNLTPTGFTTVGIGSGDWIYVAIRRGPMKTPTDATKVLANVLYTGSSSAQTITGVAFSPDYIWSKDRSAGNNGWHLDRLRGVFSLDSSTTGAEQDRSPYFGEFTQDGFRLTSGGHDLNRAGSNHYSWTLRRAPGFFDVVAYTGTGSLLGVTHNLQATPELKIIKRRSSTSDWVVGGSVLGESAYLYLNTTDAKVTSSNYWNGGDDSSTVFSVRNTNAASDASGSTYIAYLFASCPGVSKVGSYTGTGTTLNVDCGFTAGARFVLIKRTDSTGDWYVWDTARGIVSGNDPYLLLNSTAAEVTSTDYINPLSSGFQISSTAPAAINANGGSFIFLAIA